MKARGKLLARPRGPGNQHPRIRRADALDEAAQVGHRGRPADEPGRGARAGAQIVDFALKPRGLQRALGHQNEAVGLERLLDEVVGAELYRGHGCFNVAVAGNHHHRHARVLLFDHFQQLQAVEPRALQPDVEQHEVRSARLDRCDRFVGIARQPRRMALVGENAGDEFANVVFVVNDQDICGHRLNSRVVRKRSVARRRAWFRRRRDGAGTKGRLQRHVRRRRAPGHR